jgi:hypothetical protein
MRTGAIAIMLFAGLSRLARAGCRWEEWGLHYAAYNTPTLEALYSNAWWEAARTWVGLHPPLYPLIHSVGSLAFPSPWVWGAFSAMCSMAAVALLLHAHPKTLMPALLLATDPVQLHYAAEVNNYPLSVLLISAAWWAVRTERTWLLTLTVILSAWTHVMAGAVCALIAITHPQRWRVLGPASLAILPLTGHAWTLAGDASTQRQPGMNLELSVQDAIDRFSVVWVVLLPMLALGMRRAPAAGMVWAGTVFMWAGMVALGIAAPHQFPYAMFLGVPAAVLLSTAADHHHGFKSIVFIAAIGRGLWGLGDSVKDGSAILKDQAAHRGIDAVLSLSLPGDAIVLVRGPGAPDDDRRHISPVLWRFSPFDVWLPIFTGVRPDLVGQPRLVRGRRVYTFAHPRPALSSIPGAHVFTVLYDGAEHNRERIPAHPRQGDWVQAGPDLWRGPIFSGPSSGSAAASGAEENGASPPGLPDLD